MAVVMFVTLYISRIVLNVLGVEDYGIYNVVSGIVVLFSFLNTALTNATQRYFSICIANKNHDDLIKVFSTSIFLHFLVIIFVLLLTETFGLWYIKEKLSLPDGKLALAVGTYHLAIIATCINIIRVPFQAILISNEQMSVYAIITVLETILKLFAVLLLPLLTGEKLLLYSFLNILVFLLIFLTFVVYTVLKYRLKIVLLSDVKLLKEFAIFSGWNMLGGVADITYQQGTNLILNHFGGVIVNAAVGIMNQVRTAVFSFVSNLQLAANPQIIKSYSSDDFSYFYSLISLISRLSYYLILLFAIPLILNIEFILEVWLKIVPPYTPIFCKLILIYCLIDSLSGPLWVAIQATGKMKTYQLVISVCLISNLPISYFALRGGAPLPIVYIIQIFLCCVAMNLRLIIAKKYVNLNLSSYFKEIVLKILIVTVLSSLVPIICSYIFEGFLKFIVTSIFNTLSLVVTAYYLGITCDERNRVVSYIKNKIKI